MRSYVAASSDFDDGSKVEGLAWSPLRGRFVATALCGNPTSYQGNVDGLTSYCHSTTGIAWTFGASVQMPQAPGEVADCYWSTGYSRFYTAGSWDPSFWGAQPDGESNSLAGAGTWAKLTRATTATRETTITVVEAGTGSGNVIVGGELVSGTGRLIGKSTGSATGPFTAISTPIDNQFFRVTQVASHPTISLLVAALKPVGVVSSTERIMTSSDGGVTWTMRSSGLDGDAGYGVCWNASLAQWLVTGTQQFVTSPDGITWTTHSAAGVDVQGKPCAALAVTIIPGGSSATVSEWNGTSLGSQTISLITNIQVAAYSPILDRVVIGGLGEFPFHALWYADAPVAAVVPSLDVKFDLG